MSTVDATDLFSAFVLRGKKLPDHVHTVTYEAYEAISEPFSVEVEFYTLDSDFEALDALGSSMVLTVINEGGQTRYFHGIADRIGLSRTQGERLFFKVHLSPSLSALALREDCRIFQDESVVDVTTKLLDEAGLGGSVRWDIVETYAPKEFIVQYRESALNFLTRLFEDFSLFYFFEHAEDSHTLIIADHADAFSQLDAPLVEFAPIGGGVKAGEPLPVFSRTRSLRANSATVRDYDFEKPQAFPEASLPYQGAWPMASYFDYPADFVEPNEGKLRAQARLGQLRHDADVSHGESEAIDLRVGVPFAAVGATADDLNGDFVTTRLVSKGLQDPSEGVEPFACRNEFSAIPKGALWMPPLRARRPSIRGVQTAVVTGKETADEAIHVDKYGRIKVRFFWDRINQQDDTSSCWIRVSQVPLGGSMVLPRVGWEVSVAFLEGDPDRPIVLGRLYNAQHPPPDALPGAKASGSLKSMSSPGGGGFNMIGANDTGGSQGFNIHAEKDLNISTGNDWNEEIGVNDTHNVTKNMSHQCGSDETIQVSGNQSLSVGANHEHKIGGSQTVSVGGNDETDSTADTQETIGGSRTYTVGGTQTTISNGITQNMKGGLTRTVGSVHLVGSVATISDNVLVARTSNVGAVRAALVNGTHGESVKGAKLETTAAVDLHVNDANRTCECSGAVTNMIGGLHYQKIDGDYSVKAPMITLLGAVADIKGGSSTLKLGGGPIVLKGSKISFKAPLCIKVGGSLKES